MSHHWKEGVTFYGSRVIESLSEFKHSADVIIANRISEELSDVLEKVYTRDLFSEN